jgi:hypothetical protein
LNAWPTGVRAAGEEIEARFIPRLVRCGCTSGPLWHDPFEMSHARHASLTVLRSRAAPE